LPSVVTISTVKDAVEAAGGGDTCATPLQTSSQQLTTSPQAFPSRRKLAPARGWQKMFTINAPVIAAHYVITGLILAMQDNW
jgi:hypothetical protein